MANKRTRCYFYYTIQMLNKTVFFSIFVLKQKKIKNNFIWVKTLFEF